MSFLKAQSLSEFDYSRSVLESGDKFQGDIVLTEIQREEIALHIGGQRTGLLETVYRWPKNIVGFVEVPYTFREADNFSIKLNFLKSLLSFDNQNLFFQINRRKIRF